MLVNLERGWFGPDGSSHKPGDNPHDFPDSWKELLPTTASVIGVSPIEEDEDEEPVEKPAAKPEAKK